MTTRAQIASNRRNSKKATGPKTRGGKERSRANSYKDGLAGAGVVLAPEDQAEIERLLPEYQKLYKADDVEKQVLLRRLVFESVRLERCGKAEFAARGAAVRRARLAWDEDRAAEAAALGLKLSARPAAVAGELRRSYYGCCWLYDRWVVLRDVLETNEDWDDDERNLALDLLGIDNDLRKPGLTVVDRPVEGVPSGDHRFALAEAEIERLVERIDGPMHELDQADQLRAVNDATLFENPDVLRIHRAEQKAFRNFMRLRVELNAAESREPVDSEPEPEPAFVPTPKPAVQFAPKPVVEPPAWFAPKPVAESTPKTVVELAPKPMVEPPLRFTPKPVEESAPRPVEESAPKPAVPFAPKPGPVVAPPASASASAPSPSRTMNRKQRRALEKKVMKAMSKELKAERAMTAAG